MPKIKVSGDPDKNWANDAIQFPRLIAELEAAGAFTTQVFKGLMESTDLDEGQICELLERAQATWDDIKARTKGVKLQ